MKLNAYSRMSIVISIEIYILMIINFVIRLFYKEFDVLYILIPQICLLVTQLIILILEKRDYNLIFKNLFD